MSWEINFTLDPDSSTAGEAVAINSANGFTRRAFVDTSDPASINAFVESCHKNAGISAERAKVANTAKQALIVAFNQIDL